MIVKMRLIRVEKRTSLTSMTIFAVTRSHQLQLSQCSMLVRNTVVRAIHTVNGRLENSTPRGSKTPEPIEMKLYMVDYVTHPTAHAQFG